jgi:hypothetical protein
MSSHRSPRMSRRTVERMLDGAPAPSDAPPPLAALLHAATAPAHPAELAGERAALTAFEAAAQLDPVPSPRRQNVLKSTLAKILTVKAAIILAATAGTTGVVLASTTGALQATEAPEPVGPQHTVHSAPHTTHKPSDTGKPAETGKPNGATATPDPSTAGLCNAYEAHRDDNPGKALDNPAFTALITAAGGKDNVDEYCDAIAARKDTGRSDETHGKPTDAPDDPGNGTPGNGAPGNGAGNGHAPATHPAAPPSRDHAPAN